MFNALKGLPGGQCSSCGLLCKLFMLIDMHYLYVSGPYVHVSPFIAQT